MHLVRWFASIVLAAGIALVVASTMDGMVTRLGLSGPGEASCSVREILRGETACGGEKRH